jgi:flagellar hook-associated protein 2
MKVGSGVDISELAESLATAETAALISTRTRKKEAASASISGLAILKESLSQVQNALDALTDKGSVVDKSVSSQNDSRLTATITAQSKVQAGTHKFHCRQLARPQVNELTLSGGSSFSSASQVLNSGNAFSLAIASPHGASATSVSVSVATPDGIVDAINAANVNGLRAYTLNKLASGDAVVIMLEGKTGAANSFQVTDTNSIGLENQTTSNRIQAATDLKLVMNRTSNADTTDAQMVLRDNNSPSDLIEGVQLNFKSATGSGSFTTTNIVIAEDKSAFTTAITNVQNAYNAMVDTTGVLTGKLESDSDQAGALKGDKSLVDSLVRQVWQGITAESSTPSSPITSMRQLGVAFDLSGKLTIDKVTFDAAVVSNFTDITKMLTANTNNQSEYSDEAKGLAQDVVNIIEGIINNQGVIESKKTSTSQQVTRYEIELTELQTRYENAKKRYLSQFAAMETLVAKSKSTGDYLTSQFKAMQGGND